MNCEWDVWPVCLMNALNSCVLSVGIFSERMGLHQFKLSMLPRTYFDRIGSPVPAVLTKEDIDRGERADSGWWASLQPTPQALTSLRQLCPHEKSWGETEECVTSETSGSDLRIWKEQGR